jgi:hypothetical protein
MKIRGVEEFVGFLDEQKQRRRRELTSVRFDLTPEGRAPSSRVTRSAIVLAYAHWEGFVKEAARAYVDLVSHKSRSLSALAANFQALVCRQELRVAQSASKRIAPHIAVIDRLTVRAQESVTIDPSLAIDTESNLNAEVFRNICECVGVDYSSTWSNEGPSMNDLFQDRCAIAHGDLLEPDSKYSIEVVDLVLRWISTFSTALENAAIQKAYLKES